MRECQFSLGTSATTCILVPIAENRVALTLDKIEIVGDDLADRLLKARQVGLLPGAKLVHLGFGKVLHLVLGRIVNIVAERPEHGRDFRTPAFA